MFHFKKQMSGKLRCALYSIELHTVCELLGDYNTEGSKGGLCATLHRRSAE